VLRRLEQVGIRTQRFQDIWDLCRGDYKPMDGIVALLRDLIVDPSGLEEMRHLTGMSI
jgi:hypothetical protein